MASDWIFLSKHGRDEYINMLAHGAGAEPMNSDDFDYYYDVFKDQRTLVLRGILKHKIMQQCLKDGRTFWYMDSGYLGNVKSPTNPMGNKTWHRLVRNDLQHDAVVPRRADRFERLGIRLQDRRHGSRIIVAAPDDKPCRYYGIDRQQWITDTVAELKRHTDRPILVRERAPRRIDRVETDPLSVVLQQDVHALVTFNSNAGVEAILAGVPAFVLAPTHAAAPVGNRDLSRINEPLWAPADQRYEWLCHLAYCQYSVKELRDGTAYRMINEA